jgi:hypothetical protein
LNAPQWLGIGAHRSGTTWFTDLLTQHPDVKLGTNGKKEQHLLHKVGDGLVEPREYLDLFPADGTLRGEWTPTYLRHPSAPVAAARLVPDAPILVLLRDPVERYRSAMRLAATRQRSRPYPIPMQIATWAGFYADQLAGWADQVGKDRLHVLVYEHVTNDPQPAVDAVWSLLGQQPVPLQDTTARSTSSSTAPWTWPDGLEQTLRAMYRPQVERLEREWSLDLSPWASVRSTSA